MLHTTASTSSCLAEVGWFATARIAPFEEAAAGEAVVGLAISKRPSFEAGPCSKSTLEACLDLSITKRKPIEGPTAGPITVLTTATAVAKALHIAERIAVQQAATVPGC